MVYDWEAHRETCYRLYIDEGKSLDDIMIWMKAQHNFTPSKRAYQTQFKRWAFPAKRRPPHTDTTLVERVEELWQRNLSQREMHRILVQEDGFGITPRDLVRVRARNGWLLRASKRQGVAGEDDVDEDMTDEEEPDNEAGRSGQVEMGTGAGEGIDGSGASPGATAKTTSVRQSKRHRHRTLGSDASPRPSTPGSPIRFPSEMTLDSARHILALPVQTYRTVRSAFHQICTDANIIKKSTTSAESWCAAKATVVGRIPHLGHIFGGADEYVDPKMRLALDVICTDVAKRARVSGARMTLAEARRVLGWDPKSSRREALKLKQSLKREGLKVVTESLDTAVRRWEASSRTVAALLAEDGQSERKKALKAIAKDVMKRVKEGDGAREVRRRRAAGLPELELELDLALLPSPAPSCPSSSPLQSSPPPLAPNAQRREAIGIPPFHTLDAAAAAILPVPSSSRPHEHAIGMTMDLGYNLGPPNDDAVIQGGEDSMPDTMVPPQQPSILFPPNDLSDTHTQHPARPHLDHPHHQTRQHVHHHQHDHQRQHQSFLIHPYQHHSSQHHSSQHRSSQHSFQHHHHQQAQIHAHSHPQPSLFQQTQSHHAQPFFPLPEPLPFPMPAYINMHLPLPTTHAPPTIISFITPIISTSIHELCAPILSQYPGTTCQRIDGVLRVPAMPTMISTPGTAGEAQGREFDIMILTDAMLETYLRHMRDSPPTLNIVLAWKA